MKTLQELYNEVIGSEELKKEFAEAAKEGKALDFIKTHGVDASADEIKAFFDGLVKKDKELSADELENAAGGTCNSATCTETLLSVFSVGIGCTAFAIVSYVYSEDRAERYKDDPNPYNFPIGGHVGQRYDNDGRLCNKADGDGSILT